MSGHSPRFRYECIAEPGYKFRWNCGPTCACVLSPAQAVKTELEHACVRIAEHQQERWREGLLYRTLAEIDADGEPAKLRELPLRSERRKK